MHVLKTNFNGNSNIGLFAFCNDKFCLIGREVDETDAKRIEKVLKVPVHRISIAGTSLIGVFINGNNKKIIVPGIAFDYELETLRKLNIDFEVIDTRLTALGNNILCNDNGCLANPEFSADQKKRIRTALDVPLKPGKIAGLDTVGSLAVLNSKGCLIHRDVSDAEKEFIEDLLKIKCSPSTINMGSPYLKSGIICNNNGFIVGDTSGGPEMVNAEEELGFLDK